MGTMAPHRRVLEEAEAEVVQAVLSADRTLARAWAVTYAAARDQFLTPEESQAAAQAILEAIHHPTVHQEPT